MALCDVLTRVPLVIILLLAAITAVSPDLVSAERRLITDLLARYERLGRVARPLSNSSRAVDVQFGIRLVHLDLDEKDQVMKTSVWVRMAWVDELLTWDMNEYGGVTTVVLPADMVWVPDIVLVNTAETSVKEQPADVIVKYDGTNFWAPERKYSSACLIDVTEYPYDRHTCDMWFQSISNRADHLSLRPYYSAPLDLDTYLTSYKHAQEWLIISNSSTLHDRPRDVGMILMWSRRPSLRLTLAVERRPGFQAMLLIVPCALLSFIVPLMFCLPPERPDRHSLAMSLFASLTILLFMVNDVAPPSASFVPRLALYYCFNLLVLLLATCCSVLVVNISKRGETRERVPKVVKVVIIKGIGKFLCFGTRLNYLSDVKRASKHSSPPKDQEPQRIHNNGFAAPPELFPAQSMMNQHIANQENQLLLLVNQRLSSIESRLLAENSAKSASPDVTVATVVKMEWKYLAMVLDRLLFITFVVVNLITLAVFHPRKTY